MQGELRFRDTFRVDGKVKGRIVSDNTLIIGESAQVDAEIDCGVVSIRGTVTGRVKGRERIELLAARGCRPRCPRRASSSKRGRSSRATAT
jgi:cytoskeletal protein CcmA (bactofilin family)